MAIKVNDNIGKFSKKSIQALDVAFSAMGADIERLSKLQVPHLTGALKSSGRVHKFGPLQYRVEYNKEYARYQHEGGDGRRTVRNYSKPGKKKFFLKDPGVLVTSKAVEYFKRYTP